MNLTSLEEQEGSCSAGCTAGHLCHGTTRLTKALVSWIDAMRDQPRLRARQACGEEGASNQLQCQLQTDGLRMQESGGTCVGDTYGAVAPLHTSVAPLIAGTQMHFAHWGALRARHLSSPPVKTVFIRHVDMCRAARLLLKLHFTLSPAF